MTRKILPHLLLPIFLLAACDEPPEQPAPPSFGALDGGVLVDAALPDGASDSEAPKPTRVGPVFAVVSSDYAASSISLLDVHADLIADDYLNSGSARAGLVTALSGDVTLPSHTGESGVLVLLDRYKSDVITRVRLSDGTILGQVKTHTPPLQATMSAYSSNPHDYIALSPTSAWVTRPEPNLDPSVAEIDRGTDLLRLDPSTMQRTSDRIDLSVLNTRGTRINLMTSQPEEVEVYARPSRIARVGNTLVVGLGRLSFDFSAYGPGMVALVDTETRALSSVALEGLASCSDVGLVPGQPDLVLVGCSGFRRPPADPRATGGIALLRVVGGSAQIEHVWRASEHPADPAAFNHVFSLGGSLVAAVSTGARASTALGDKPAVAAAPDQLFVIDLATGTFAGELLRAEAPYSLSRGLYDAESGLILVPDASVDANKRPTAGVRRLRFSAPANFAELPVVKVAERLHMPVRSIDFL